MYGNGGAWLGFLDGTAADFLLSGCWQARRLLDLFGDDAEGL
jgi:hypothetical protein